MNNDFQDFYIFIPEQTIATDAFKPTRRVRTVPGGPHTDIFAQDDEGDALSMAPPKPVDEQVWPSPLLRSAQR